jgi:hypothetical protein
LFGLQNRSDAGTAGTAGTVQGAAAAIVDGRIRPHEQHVIDDASDIEVKLSTWRTCRESWLKASSSERTADRRGAAPAHRDAEAPLEASKFGLLAVAAGGW